MLYYRVKPEADGKPLLLKRRGRVQTWSVYVKGELFTPNEVVKMNLNKEYLTAVDVNQRKTQKVFGARMPTMDASITPIKERKEVYPNAEVESIARFIMFDRPDGGNERGSQRVVRDTRHKNAPHRVRRQA